MATSQVYTDHLGNTFRSLNAMCKHYEITKSAFTHRIKHNWSLEQALTQPVKISCTSCVDHLGNQFESIKAMCKHWNITASIFKHRMKYNWTLEKALTTPLQEYIDHLGNTFSNRKEMCKYWHITTKVYNDRKKQNWSLEKILTTPVHRMSKPCTDHLGNTFKSKSEMCRFWDIPVSAYENRVDKRHWSSERALTTPLQEYIDIYGNQFKNRKEMCDAYHISMVTFRDNMQNDKSLIEALRIIPLLSQHVKNYTFDKHLIIIEAFNHKNKASYTPKYFICLFDDHEVILPYKWIIQYCEQHLPPEKNPMRQC